MIGHFIVINDADHDRFQVCRVVEKLTKQLYLVASVCADHGKPNGVGMFVLDIKMLAETHEEWGPRGQIFETWEQYHAFFGDGPGDDADAVAEPAPVAVH
jgi:hypothetical protein